MKISIIFVLATNQEHKILDAAKKNSKKAFFLPFFLKNNTIESLVVTTTMS